MIIELGLVLGTLLVATLAWNLIRNCFAKYIIPALRKRVSGSVADSVARLVSWLDSPLSATRRAVRQLLATFKEHVLGIRTRLAWRDSRTVAASTTSLIRNPQTGEAYMQTAEEILRPEDLPTELRAKLAQLKELDIDVAQEFTSEVERQALTLEATSA
jgi:hypothetical protein